MKVGVSLSQYFSMEWPLVKSLLWALLLLIQIHEHRGCIGEERMGLIELKAFLNSKNNYTNRLILPSWVNETKSECCGWEGVTCNTTTGHVIELSLYNLKQETDDETWYLNACFFQPFKELRSLNLSFRHLTQNYKNLKVCDPSPLPRFTFRHLTQNYKKKEEIYA
jgi:hypothetical protein